VRFETIPAGETRQLNGPWFGVRVLIAGKGSALTIDRVALPVPDCLPSIEGEIDRVNATGPITFVISETQGEDLAKANASPQPPGLAPASRVEVIALGTNPGAFAGRTVDLVPEADEVALDVWADVPKVLSTNFGGELSVRRPAGVGAVWLPAGTTGNLSASQVAGQRNFHRWFSAGPGRLTGGTDQPAQLSYAGADTFPKAWSGALNPYGYRYVTTQGDYAAGVVEPVKLVAIWQKK
jgi:hypothetical protein